MHRSMHRRDYKIGGAGMRDNWRQKRRTKKKHTKFFSTARISLSTTEIAMLQLSIKMGEV
jgi:hypothetical protein